MFSYMLELIKPGTGLFLKFYIIMDKIHFRGFSIALLACMICAIHAYSQVDKQENTIQNTFQAPELGGNILVIRQD